jgi:hypothetical protein
MARISHWTALVALGVGGLAAGCGSAGRSPPQHVSMCGSPVYTFTLADGKHVGNGDCAGYLFAKPPSLTVRRGETFTLTPGNSAGVGVPPVPRPSGPAVIVLSTQRTPHAGTRATYRAVRAGRALLLVPHHTELCQGRSGRGVTCPAAALAVQVTG